MALDLKKIKNMCKPKYVPVLLSMHRERTTPDSLGAGRWRTATETGNECKVEQGKLHAVS